MANEIAPGGHGQVWLRVESSPGTSTASWKQARVDGLSNIIASTMELVEAGKGGHRNPYSQDKPVGVQKGATDAFTIKSRVHRASTDGNDPIMATLFEAAGWNHAQGPTSQATSSGSPSTTSITVDDATGLVAGEACLVELAGTYYPTLAADVTGNTITPSIAMPSAQDGSTDVVELMHSFTPTTDTVYEVPSDKTLQARINTLQYYDDAGGDGSYLATFVGVSGLGAIEIGEVGSPIIMDWTMHAGKVVPQADDIAADSFQDSEQFAVVTENGQFAIAGTNSGSGIATLVRKNISKLTFNCGVQCVPIGGTGGTNIGGWQAYRMEIVNPSVTIEAYLDGDTANGRMFLDELSGSNSSKYVHYIEPVTDPDSPAFGIWMPNCHLQTKPEIDIVGEMHKITATLTTDLANWGGSATDIDEVAAAPIVVAVSGECA